MADEFATGGAGTSPDVGATPASGSTSTGYGEPEAVSPAGADRRASEQHGALESHPELLAAAAFAGGFVLAQVLKRVTGGD